MENVENIEEESKGRGWHGNTAGHREAGRKGGLAPHRIRGLAAASVEVRTEVARKGGIASTRKAK